LESLKDKTEIIQAMLDYMKNQWKLNSEQENFMIYFLCHQNPNISQIITSLTKKNFESITHEFLQPLQMTVQPTLSTLEVIFIIRLTDNKFCDKFISLGTDFVPIVVHEDFKTDDVNNAQSDNEPSSNFDRNNDELLEESQSPSNQKKVFLV
jgi:hypothetical protein